MEQVRCVACRTIYCDETCECRCHGGSLNAKVQLAIGAVSEVRRRLQLLPDSVRKDPHATKAWEQIKQAEDALVVARLSVDALH